MAILHSNNCAFGQGAALIQVIHLHAELESTAGDPDFDDAPHASRLRGLRMAKAFRFPVL
jgi:hypothetical protein